MSGTWRSKKKRCSVTEAEGRNGIGNVIAKTHKGHTRKGLSLATSKAGNLRTPSEDLTENTDQKGKEIP